MSVCLCGFTNERVYVCLGFVMCVCVCVCFVMCDYAYVWFLYCVVVWMCRFCNVWFVNVSVM